MDSNWRIYVNPEHAMKASGAELAADLIHALTHGLRDHANRGETAVQVLGGWEAWHVAGCCEINDDLAADGLECGEHQLFPWMFDLENGKLAEVYFSQLSDDGPLPQPNAAGASGMAGEGEDESEWPDDSDLGDSPSDEADDDAASGGSKDDPDNKDVDGEGDGGSGPDQKQSIDCGSSATGRSESWELTADSETLSSGEQQIMRRITAEEIAQHAKHRGDVPASLARWADELLNPKVDWRKALSSAVRRAVHHKAGRADWTWARTPRRQRQGPVQKPGMHQPVPDLAVVVDTSGSMSQHDLAHALTEIKDIIRKVVPGEALRVLAVDAEVASTARVFDVRKVELAGGGGTDMRVGIAEAVEARPSAVVVLTDGYTPWPDDRASVRGVPVIAGLIGTHADIQRTSSSVPAWIKTVEIDTER